MTPFQFRDRLDRVWDVKLNLAKTMRVDRSDFANYTQTRVVLSRYDKDTVVLVLTDTALLFAVIGVICWDQIQEQFKKKLEEIPEAERPKADALTEWYQSEFADGIGGETIEPARAAFVEALQDFFPAAKTVLSTSLQKVRQYESEMVERLEKEVLPRVDQEVKKLMDEEIATLLTRLGQRSSVSSVSSDLPVTTGNG